MLSGSYIILGLENENSKDNSIRALCFPLHFYFCNKHETGNVVICFVTNKRRFISVKGKVKMIRKIQNGKKEADAYWESGQVNPTIENIWKNINRTISAFEQDG